MLAKHAALIIISRHVISHTYLPIGISKEDKTPTIHHNSSHCAIATLSYSYRKYDACVYIVSPHPSCRHLHLWGHHD